MSKVDECKVDEYRPELRSGARVLSRSEYRGNARAVVNGTATVVEVDVRGVHVILDAGTHRTWWEESTILASKQPWDD